MPPQTYTIQYLRPALRELQKIDRVTLKRLQKRIEGLAKDPRPPGVEKLKGADNEYRVRVGSYRVLYLIEDENLVVVIVRAAHRRDVYERR